MKQDLKNFTPAALEKWVKSNGLPIYLTQQVFSWVHKRRIEDFSLMTDISKPNQNLLADAFYFSKIQLLKRQVSLDGTEKFMFKLKDKYCIETVLIPEGRRITLCLSTQVGCPFGCLFCLSGKGGFKRNLSISEIIAQAQAAEDLISPRKITNIVFMGIGEPLDNFSNTIGAIQILTYPQGAYFGRKKICVSTCGIIPKIKEFYNLNLGVRLSVSLHSADSQVRSQIMPVNKKYPLEELIETFRHFSIKNKEPITFEYILIKGINSRRQDVFKLTKLLRGIKYKLNIILYNSSFLKFSPPSSQEIDIFKEELKRKGVLFILRKPRGQDIKAACGQLSYESR